MQRGKSDRKSHSRNEVPMWLEYGGLNVQTNYGATGDLLLVLYLTSLQAVKGYGTSIRLSPGLSQ